MVLRDLRERLRQRSGAATNRQMLSMPTGKYRADFICVVALVAIFLGIALPRYRASIDWGDEGFLAYSAVRVMEGEMPHRDFVSLQPPMSFYVVAIAFKLFGTS